MADQDTTDGCDARVTDGCDARVTDGCDARVTAEQREALARVMRVLRMHPDPLVQDQATQLAIVVVALYEQFIHDPAEMPEGPERTQALRQMLIDTMSAVEQTDDCERMSAAVRAFDDVTEELKSRRLRLQQCEHVFSDAEGRTRYTFCQRGCGTRDPAAPPAVT